MSLTLTACTSEGTVGVWGPGDATVGPAPEHQSCSADADCTDSGEPRCDRDEGLCHECLLDTDCSAGAEVCAPWRECEERCEGDADCEGDESCDPLSQVCLSCRTDAECDEGQHCDEGECERDS